MQKARSHPFLRRDIGLLLLVGAWFQVLITPLEGVLFTIQSLYWFTIGHQVVLSLGGWAPQLHTKFHEHRATLDTVSKESFGFRVRDYHRLWCDFPDTSAILTFVTPQQSTTPGRILVWAMSAFARRYLRSLN